jgi:hypothetical protein
MTILFSLLHKNNKKKQYYIMVNNIDIVQIVFCSDW